MHIYLNVHGMLEQLRQKADSEKTRGPRVRKKNLIFADENEYCSIDHGNRFTRCW